MRYARSMIAVAGALVIAACHPSLRPYRAFCLNNPLPHNPREVSAQFLGVSTILLDDGRTKIMTDGFFTRPGLKGVKADVVFLGIALLGRQSEQFRLDYWREVVRTTGAKLVVPIHWDDFTNPLDQKLHPFSRLFDDFETGINWVLQMAEADGVRVRFLPTFTPVDIFREADRP